MIKILFVCLGNICRSAAAEAVMKSILEEHGVSDKFFIDSAGILSVHQGERADARMRSVASTRGYNVTSISRPVTYDDFDKFDWIIGMDDNNVEALLDKAVTQEQKEKVLRMADFSTDPNVTYVPDPYYGGLKGFDNVIDILEDACDSLYRQVYNLNKSTI